MMPSHAFSLLSGTAVVAILAGCSGGVADNPQTNEGNSSIAQANVRHDSIVDALSRGRHRFIRSGSNAPMGFVRSEVMAPGGAAYFISDAGNQAVYILSRQFTLTATLTGFSTPEGLTVDKSRNLYVVNTVASDILVYAPPYVGTPKVLADPGFQPADVAVDGHGNVAVTNVVSNSNGPGGVVFYAKGATSPTKRIGANSRFGGDYFCAFDADGNLFLGSKNGSGPFEAGEIVGGISGTSVKSLTTSNLIIFPVASK